MDSGQYQFLVLVKRSSSLIAHIVFRLALVILFGTTLTATMVGFWLGFDRTVVRQSLIIPLSCYLVILWQDSLQLSCQVILLMLIPIICWEYFQDSPEKMLIFLLFIMMIQVYLPLNLSLSLAFLVLVIRAVHYFTQPDQREKVCFFCHHANVCR